MYIYIFIFISSIVVIYLYIYSIFCTLKIGAHNVNGQREIRCPIADSLRADGWAVQQLKGPLHGVKIRMFAHICICIFMFFSQQGCLEESKQWIGFIGAMYF